MQIVRLTQFSHEQKRPVHLLNLNPFSKESRVTDVNSIVVTPNVFFSLSDIWSSLLSFFILILVMLYHEHYLMYVLLENSYMFFFYL